MTTQKCLNIEHGNLVSYKVCEETMDLEHYWLVIRNQIPNRQKKDHVFALLNKFKEKRNWKLFVQKRREILLLNIEEKKLLL